MPIDVSGTPDLRRTRALRPVTPDGHYATAGPRGKEAGLYSMGRPGRSSVAGVCDPGVVETGVTDPGYRDALPCDEPPFLWLPCSRRPPRPRTPRQARIASPPTSA